MLEIKSREDFNKALKEDYVMIDCTASWCGPCQKIKPKIENLSKDKDYEEVSFYVYDIDDDEDLSVEYITVVPTFLFFKDGELFGKVEGADIKMLLKN
jgi:thioredoxin 1